MKLEQLQERLDESRQQAMQAEQALSQTGARSEQLRKLAPAWLVAQEKLEKLRELSAEALENPQAVSSAMHKALELEREAESQKNRLQQRKSDLEALIRRLQSVGGEVDERLSRIAEQLDGVLLCDVYDDISLEDAPYYSALYGPARAAIVVADLEQTLERVSTLEDVPEDLYFIRAILSLLMKICWVPASWARRWWCMLRIGNCATPVSPRCLCSGELPVSSGWPSWRVNVRR